MRRDCLIGNRVEKVVDGSNRSREGIVVALEHFKRRAAAELAHRRLEPRNRELQPPKLDGEAWAAYYQPLLSSAT
jgi:hypothetical protein